MTGQGEAPATRTATARGRPIAVVAGASAGIGRATARELARRGFDVGLLARGRDGLEGARSEVEAEGGRAVVVTVDVSDATAVEDAAEQIESTLGPIDVWINNAMVTVLAPVSEMRPEDFRRVAEVNFLGTVHGTQSALARMRARNRGTIVQVGSALAYRSIPLQSAYCASKFAVRGFTDSLRSELLHEGSDIRLCMVQLPALNTPQFTWCRTTLDHQPQPVPPIFQPEVAARAIVDAAQAPKREVWLGFPAWKAIVGSMLAPSFADRVLARNGFDGQQTDELLPADHVDNLYEPVSGDHGAHGPFDRRARERSVMTSLLHGLQRVRIRLGALHAG